MASVCFITLFSDMNRKLHTCIVLIILTAFCAAPVQSFAMPECHYEHNSYTGEDLYKPGSLEASYVDYVQGTWKCDTKLPGRRGQCGHWSNLVRNVFASSERRKDYYGLRFNKKNFLSVCKGCRPGTKLVLGQAKYENGTLSHAIVLFKVTSKEVWWADCNWDDDNVIHYRHGGVKDFINFYHYKSSKYSYLHFVVKIKRYRHYSKPKLEVADTVTDGTARIVWTKTSGARKYYVYRSASKKGKFKRIAETKACSFVDDTAKTGKRYYYMVAAVDKKGKKKWSGKADTKTRLDRPHVSVKYPKGKKGRLVWEKVPEAGRYIVYRKYAGGRWKKIKTTRKTYYSDSLIKRGRRYWYKVKAVKKKKSRSASVSSPWATTMVDFRRP